MRFVMKGLFCLCLVFLHISCQSAGHQKIDEPIGEEHTGSKKGDGQEAEELASQNWLPIKRELNAQFLFLVAEMEMMENKLDSARRHYEEAYSLDPNAIVGAKWVASKSQIDPDSALLEARKMTLLYPSNPDIFMLYGRILAASGQFDKAENVFKKVKTLDPKRVEAYLGLISIYGVQSKDDEAIKEAKQLTLIVPDYPVGWANLAKLYIGKEKNSEALYAAKRAYDLDSNDPELILLYAFCLEVNKQSDKAIHLYESLFRTNPTNPSLIKRIVDLYKELGNLEDALKLLEEAEQRVDKVTAGIRLQRIFILWELERYSEASQLLDDLNKLFPDSDRIAYMSALGQEKIGRLTAAIRSYQKIAEDSPFFMHAAFRSVLILRKLNDVENAIELIKRVIALETDKARDFYMLLAEIYSDQKNYEMAITILAEAYEKFPEEHQFLFLQGVNEEKRKNIDKCISIMRTVIQRDPKHVVALNYLGYLFAERGENLDEAEKLILSALKLRPNDGYYLDSLGWVYYQKGDYQRALETLLKADKESPNEGIILEHISDAYLKLGNKEKAFEYLRKATKSHLDERDKDRILHKFEEMKKNAD